MANLLHASIRFFVFLHVFLILHTLTHPECIVFNRSFLPLLFQESPRGGADGLRGHVQPGQLGLQPRGGAAAGHGAVCQGPGGGGDQEEAGGGGAA